MTSLVRGQRLADLTLITPNVRKAAKYALTLFHQQGAAHGDVTLQNLILVSDPPDRIGGTSQGCSTCSSSAGGRESEVGAVAFESAHRARVVIIDLGRAYVGASGDEQSEEMARLCRLLYS